MLIISSKATGRTEKEATVFDCQILVHAVSVWMRCWKAAMVGGWDLFPKQMPIRVKISVTWYTEEKANSSCFILITLDLWNQAQQEARALVELVVHRR